MAYRSTGFLLRLAQQCAEDSERWFGDMNSHNLVHHSLAMAGEVGEFCNLVKKIDRGSLDFRAPATRIRLAEELTDVLVYVLNLAAILQVDLEKSYQGVREHNDKRFMEERRERDQRRSAS